MQVDLFSNTYDADAPEIWADELSPYDVCSSDSEGSTSPSMQCIDDHDDSVFDGADPMSQTEIPLKTDFPSVNDKADFAVKQEYVPEDLPPLIPEDLPPLVVDTAALPRVQPQLPVHRELSAPVLPFTCNPGPVYCPIPIVMPMPVVVHPAPVREEAITSNTVEETGCTACPDCIAFLQNVLLKDPKPEEAALTKAVWEQFCLCNGSSDRHTQSRFIDQTFKIRDIKLLRKLVGEHNKFHHSKHKPSGADTVTRNLGEKFVLISVCLRDPSIPFPVFLNAKKTRQGKASRSGRNAKRVQNLASSVRSGAKVSKKTQTRVHGL